MPRANSSALLGRALERARQAILEMSFAIVAQTERNEVDDETSLRQIGAEGADRRRDRHVVVIQDDDQARLSARAGVVHRLVGHAGAHRAIADHRDHIALVGPSSRSPPPCRGRRRSRSRSAPRRTGRIPIPNGLVKPERPPPWRMRADAVAPAGQDLVRIGLVADVPDQAVVRCVEDVMDCRRSVRPRRAPAPR